MRGSIHVVGNTPPIRVLVTLSAKRIICRHQRGMHLAGDHASEAKQPTHLLESLSDRRKFSTRLEIVSDNSVTEENAGKCWLGNRRGTRNSIETLSYYPEYMINMHDSQD